MMSLSSLTLAFIAALAFVLDRALGEPKKFHPLVGLGRWAKFVERLLWQPFCEVPVSIPTSSPNTSRKFLVLMSGFVAWCAVLLPVVVLLSFLIGMLPEPLMLVATLIVVYFSIAPRSLAEHALAVYRPLEGTTKSLEALSPDELVSARTACAMIVSRETDTLSRTELATATVETVVENANDAVIAPLFWFFVAGLPGILLFRVANTLDAMWGYRSQRYRWFGRFAARADDVLAYIPARLTVALFSLIDSRAYAVARRDGRSWYSPNSGLVMAAGAGALDLQLGGPAYYDGHMKGRPLLGTGRLAEPQDIPRALALVKRAYLLLLGLMLIVGALV